MKVLLSACILLLLVSCGGRAGSSGRSSGDMVRTFHIVEVLEGTAPADRLSFAPAAGGDLIPITDISYHEAPTPPRNPESIQMILAFQLAPGKTSGDFARFKALDAPWVRENNGSNPQTIWTERTANWPFDAFEDVTFASIEDFQRAYAGNPELNAAGEGLFGDRVLVAVVVE